MAKTRKTRKYILRSGLFLFVVAGLVFTNSGCTSKKAEDQQVVENADVEKIEAEGSDVVTEQAADPSLEAALGETPALTTPEPPSPAAAETTAAAPTLDDISLDASAASTTTEALAPEAAPPAVAATEETSTESAPALDTTVASTEPPTQSITETPSEIVEPTPIDSVAAAEATVAPADTNVGETSTSEALKPEPAAETAAAPKPTGGGLKKVATTAPYQGADGGWINTVYVARPKEKLKAISLKIYGADKSEELKKIAENSYLKNRAVKAGDKIYYVSPHRPEDSTKTILYYEDMGMVPETYVAKKGDNLKKVSKELLGYNNAWIELWTSNTVESRASLKEGETLRYWKSQEAATAAVADATAGADAAAGAAKLIDSSQAQAALPPPPADAAASLPPPPADLPPPPADAAAMGETNAAPHAADSAQPPPPPPPENLAAPARKKINLDEAAAEESAEALDSNTMMSMGALGVLVALLAFVIIRKKKQKNSMADAHEMMNA